MLLIKLIKLARQKKLFNKQKTERNLATVVIIIEEGDKHIIQNKYCKNHPILNKNNRLII